MNVQILTLFIFYELIRWSNIKKQLVFNLEYKQSVLSERSVKSLNEMLYKFQVTENQ